MRKGRSRVRGVTDLPDFFRALTALAPDPDEALARLLAQFGIPSSTTRDRGTISPRSELHHVPIRHDVMSALAQLADVRAEHDVAEHVVVYRGRRSSPFFVSRAIDEEKLAVFAQAVRGVLD
jgi:hypothetical protein